MVCIGAQRPYVPKGLTITVAMTHVDCTSFVVSPAPRLEKFQGSAPPAQSPAEDIGHQIPPPLLAVSQSVMEYETARPLDQDASDAKAASDTTRVCTRFGDEIAFFGMDLHTILVGQHSLGAEHGARKLPNVGCRSSQSIWSST